MMTRDGRLQPCGIKEMSLSHSLFFPHGKIMYCVCSNITVILTTVTEIILRHFFCFQGDVTAQGLLLKRGRATCFKKKHLPPKKSQVRRCQVFVFQETIILCDEPHHAYLSSSEERYPQNLEFLTSFKVTIRDLGTRVVDHCSVGIFSVESNVKMSGSSRILINVLTSEYPGYSSIHEFGKL